MWACSLWLSWELLRWLEKRRERERERKSVIGTKSSPRSKSLYQTQVACNGRCNAQLRPRNSPGKILLLSVKHSTPPSLPPCRGAPICGRPQKGPLWFSLLVCQLRQCHNIRDVGVSHGDAFWFSLLARCHSFRDEDPPPLLLLSSPATPLPPPPHGFIYPHSGWQKSIISFSLDGYPLRMGTATEMKYTFPSADPLLW